MTTGVRRKLAKGRDSVSTDLGLLRAFRRSVPRVAEDELGLALGVIGAQQRRHAHGDLAESLDGDWLFLHLAGSPFGLGAACVDRVLVGALVQRQTLGEVREAMVVDRPLTRTDSALTAPLLDAVLASIRDVSAYGQFRVSRRAPDPRGLVLPMEADSYLRADLTLDIAGGLHQGRLTFLFPEQPPPPTDAPARDPAELPIMRDTAMLVSAELRAVLSRIPLTLDDLAGFSPGQVLPLDDARMDRTELVAIDGRRVGTGRLGQSEGFRAIRINPVGRKPPPMEEAFGPHRARNAELEPPVDDPENEDAAMLTDLTPEDAAEQISALAGLAQEDEARAVAPSASDQPDLSAFETPTVAGAETPKAR